MDDDVQRFIDFLGLSDTEILERYSLTDGGRKLPEDEAKAFLAFIRSEIMKNNGGRAD